MNVREKGNENLLFLSLTDIGYYHIKQHMQNQDAVDFKYSGKNFCVAVSDGVGSCRKAGEGASFAVKACIKVFADIIEERVPFEDSAIKETIINRWKEYILDGKYNDYCATLKAVIRIGNEAKVISVGDGFAAISSRGFSIISPFDDSLFVNEAECLNADVSKSDFWIGDFHLDVSVPFVVFCCTDGVANGVVRGQELNLVREIETQIDLGELRKTLEDFIIDISKYSFDDKSIGVVKYEK